MKKLLHLFITAVIILNSTASQAAGLCSGVFAEEGSHESLALDSALEKAITKNGFREGLSNKDLELVVEKVFTKIDGEQYELSHYWKMTAEERTLAVLSRHLGQEVVHKGLLKYFEEHGLLVDKDRLLTKLSIINRSPLFNSAQAAWTAISITLNGTPPLMLPEVFFKVKAADKSTLLLEGLDSEEGRAITRRHGLRQETIRGYTLFSKYYTRVALAVLTYILYEKTQNYLEEKHKHESEDALNFLMKQFQKLYGHEEQIETKEDVLFDTVIENFHKKYHRLPDRNERDLICLKVYGPGGCPQTQR